MLAGNILRESFRVAWENHLGNLIGIGDNGFLTFLSQQNLLFPKKHASKFIQ